MAKITWKSFIESHKDFFQRLKDEDFPGRDESAVVVEEVKKFATYLADANGEKNELAPMLDFIYQTLLDFGKSIQENVESVPEGEVVDEIIRCWERFIFLAKVLFYVFSYILSKISNRPFVDEFKKKIGIKLSAAKTPINLLKGVPLTTIIRSQAWKDSIWKEQVEDKSAPSPRSSPFSRSARASPRDTPSGNVSGGILDAVLKMIDNWRMNDYSSELLGKLRSVVSMFESTDLVETFRSPYQDRAEKYYRSVAEARISQLGVREHIEFVYACYSSESRLSMQIIKDQKNDKIKPLIMKELVGAYITRFVDVFPHLLLQHEFDTCRKLYVLARDFDVCVKPTPPFVKSLEPGWREFIDEETRKFLSANSKEFLESPAKFVTMFSSQVSSLMAHNQNIFDNDVNFRKDCEEIFEKYCNVMSKKDTGLSVFDVCKLCAAYLNCLLDKRFSASEEDFVKGMEGLNVVMNYVTSFDVFFKAYREGLRKRIIYGLSTPEREKRFLDSISGRCDGQNDASPVTRMVKDHFDSTQITDTFLEERRKTLEGEKSETKGELSLKSSFLLLTQSVWPAHASLSYAGVPPELDDVSELFMGFYKKKYPNNGYELQPFRRSWSVSTRFVQGSAKCSMNLSLLQYLILRYVYSKPKFRVPFADLLTAVFEGDGGDTEAKKKETEQKRRTLVMLECKSLKFLNLIVLKQYDDVPCILGNPHFSPKSLQVEGRYELVDIPEKNLSEEERREKEEADQREQEDIKNSRKITTCAHMVRVLKSRVDVGGITKPELFTETAKSVSKWFTLQKDLFRESFALGLDGCPELLIEHFVKYSEDDPDIVMLNME